MPPISLMIKPSSGMCNLRCRYCFYHDLTKQNVLEPRRFMTEETLEQVLRKTLEAAEGECTIAYQGGEPTLIGLEFYQKSVELQCKYNKKNVKIYTDIAPDIFAQVDESFYIRLLVNLISNAVTYSKEKGTVKISLKKRGEEIAGMVEDDGIGMSPEFQEKMFTPFERAEDERVSQIQGTGLGLPITRNLVQMMNGTIGVESHLNKGTRFVVTIYLKLVDQDKTRRQEQEAISEVPRTFRPGTRILLAEDNELNREIVKELLSLCGLEITCAVNGREAVELFEKNPPGTYGLILMDIQMPVLDGYGASMAIRRMGVDGRRPDGAGIPIIALTANAFADDAYKAKQAGMNEHVTKPLDLDHLLETMHRWMD